MNTPKDTQADGPLLPGTESSRSLGDLMREAAAESGGSKTSDALEEAKADGHAQLASAPDPNPGRTGKIKKTSRTQQRRYARERALQALYQWDIGKAQSSDVRQQFLDTQDMSRVDIAFFVELFNGVSHDPDVVDTAMGDALDRPIEDLDPIERAVLRIAVFELTQRPDIPARVVINEGVEITKRFGADKGHRYVNGVLDKLAKQLRPVEMG